MTQITATYYPAKGTAPAFVELVFRDQYGAPRKLNIAAGPSYCAASLNVLNAADAREYAQMLRGAAEALVDFALTLEQPANFQVTT